MNVDIYSGRENDFIDISGQNDFISLEWLCDCIEENGYPQLWYYGIIDEGGENNHNEGSEETYYIDGMKRTIIFEYSRWIMLLRTYFHSLLY